MSSGEVYSALDFPAPPAHRPYAFINMVTTIDGKILSGDRGEGVLDLGSQNDHVLMKRIESFADAILLGAQTIRSSPVSWKPNPKMRIVVSGSGDLPFHSGFFQGGRSYVATTETAHFRPPDGIELIRCGADRVDFITLLERLRNEFGVLRLLVLGGSELNAQLLHANLIDELFVTIAPKVKLGRDIPTYADGEALSRDHLQRYSLLEHHAIENEIFIRYRRKESAGP